jgi:hypothetical protein
MVEVRHPGHPTAIVAKHGRVHATYARRPRCLWPGCGAFLAHDHDSPICACHVARYNIRHDRDATWLISHLLHAAFPDAVDLCAVLRSSSDDVRCHVRKLRLRGVLIEGTWAGGYRLELPPANDRSWRRKPRSVVVKKPASRRG